MFNEAVYYKPKRIQCGTSNDSLIKVEMCSLSEKTGANLSATIMMPMNKILVKNLKLKFGDLVHNIRKTLNLLKVF